MQAASPGAVVKFSRILSIQEYVYTLYHRSLRVPFSRVRF